MTGRCAPDASDTVREAESTTPRGGLPLGAASPLLGKHVSQVLKDKEGSLEGRWANTLSFQAQQATAAGPGS